jgi:hypothetical protein
MQPTNEVHVENAELSFNVKTGGTHSASVG